MDSEWLSRRAVGNRANKQRNTIPFLCSQSLIAGAPVRPIDTTITLPNHVSFVPLLPIIYNERGSNQQRSPAPLLVTMARAIDSRKGQTSDLSSQEVSDLDLTSD